MASVDTTKLKLNIPFYNADDLVKIVELYSCSNCDNFVELLTKNRREEIPHEDIFCKNFNNFFVFLFNTWKNSLLKISYDDINNNDKYTGISFDIMPVINYLSRIPDAESFSDVYKYLNVRDSEVRLFMERYGIDLFDTTNWNNITSTKLTRINNDLKKDYFITLNIKRYETPKFCQLFISRCLKKDIPFDFKYNFDNAINDNFVIEVDKRYLDNYLDIIHDIFSKYPNLASRIGRSSYLTESNNENIGFAMCTYGKDYYEKRSDYLDNSIATISRFFILNNMKKKINTKIGKTTIANYLAHNIAKRVIENEVTTYEYRKKLVDTIRKFLLNNLSELSSKRNYEIIVDNKVITIDIELMNESLRTITSEVFNNFPSLYGNLKNYLKISASSECFTTNYSNDINYNDKLVKGIK